MNQNNAVGLSSEPKPAPPPYHNVVQTAVRNDVWTGRGAAAQQKRVQQRGWEELATTDCVPDASEYKTSLQQLSLINKKRILFSLCDSFSSMEGKPLSNIHQGSQRRPEGCVLMVTGCKWMDEESMIYWSWAYFGWEALVSSPSEALLWRRSSPRSPLPAGAPEGPPCLCMLLFPLHAQTPSPPRCARRGRGRFRASRAAPGSPQPWHSAGGKANPAGSGLYLQKHKAPTTGERNLQSKKSEMIRLKILFQCFGFTTWSH